MPRTVSPQLAIAALLLASIAHAQTRESNIPYADPAVDRQVLDIHAPADAKGLPVVFWIHGGGWQGGDKTAVALKPKVFNDRGFVFVSINHRLLPNVDMATLIGDCGQALGWVHRHIADHGGDPNRIFVMGHSSGAQLAALLCTDDRYLRAAGVPFTALLGCVPVDGDTYDIPAMIMTHEFRQQLHGLSLPEMGHRQIFGNAPKKHVEYSAVTHVAKGKGIPPFLILHVAGQPDVTAQARRLANVLKAADVPVTVFGKRETSHGKLNDDLGIPDDPATQALYAFVDQIVAAKR